MKGSVTVLGFGLSEKDLPQASLDIIASADVLVGGQRHLAVFESCPSEKIRITGKISGVLDQLEKEVDKGRRVVIIASGDPLYFGIGSLVTKRFGIGTVRVVPNVSSVAGAFARLGLSWQDAGVVSLHGRDFSAGTVETIVSGRKTAIFTDPKNSPDVVAARLLENGVTASSCHIFEQMGTPDEKHVETTLSEAAEKGFSAPNIMIVLDATRTETPPAIGLGMPCDAFVYQKGLITKPEVRAVTISKLGLTPGQVLWDLGAGCGSVSIEASRFVSTVCAVEQKKERVADIRSNISRYGVTNIMVMEGRLPEAAVDLPDPDVVFIGGGGRDLGPIIRMAASRMDGNSRMVINTVLLQSLGTAVTVLEDEGFSVEVLQMSAAVSATVAWDMMLKGNNPVFIVTGIRGDS